MILLELEDTLPNGLHDAYLSGFNMSFAAGTAALLISIDVSNPEEKVRHYRDAEIRLKGVVALVVEGPGTFSDYVAGSYVVKTTETPICEALRMDSCDTTEKLYPALSTFSGKIQQMFRTLYVEEPWNSFIHIAAESAELIWTNDMIRVIE